MIKILSTDHDVSIEVEGTISDVTAELCGVITSMHDTLACKYSADIAKAFIGHIRDFMNRYNFTVSIDENIKRQEVLRSAIDGLNEIIKKYSK